MFKITSTSQLEAFDSLREEIEGNAGDLMSHFYTSEPWSGNLSNGLIQLGDRATSLHGLVENECGLLALIRCYDPDDRLQVLHVLEQATTKSSVFCYSTLIHIGSDVRRPVFCIGESTGLEGSYTGNIHGVFIFPNFKIQGRKNEKNEPLQ